MSLADFSRDEVDLIKLNGEFIQGIKATVTDKKTIIYRSDISIEVGDVLQRKASNGQIDKYEVLDPCFCEGISGAIPPHFQIKHKKIGIKKDEKLTESVTYNIGSISAEQMQVGNSNSQHVTINMQQLVDKIAKSNDEEAKGLLKKLLDNSTVASVLGASTSALIGLL